MNPARRFCFIVQWGVLEISNPGFSLAENHKKYDNQPMKKQEKKTPLFDFDALHFMFLGSYYGIKCLKYK